ncbi:hypothetical protein [Peterkaempfera sp. SMS 1(5)a]|uniref:hypothetical protein n=1 Tax=Peterkaempfera podocarpi TaxID=3232308 RepID=UPI00366F3B6D
MHDAEAAPPRSMLPARRPPYPDRGAPGPDRPPPSAAPAAHGGLRTGLAALCFTAGLGLLVGPAAASLPVPGRLAADGPQSAAGQRFALARSLWRTAPADALLPPALDIGDGTTWSRTAAPTQSPCTPALLGRGLYHALAPVGCARLLRTTYTDLARTRLVTVGIAATTAADPAAAARFARGWGRRSAGRNAGLTPPPAGGPTDSAAAWTAQPDPAGPWLVWSVSAFADGRRIAAPVPAGPAAGDRRDPLVEAGLPAAARGLAAGVSEAVDTALGRAVLRQHTAAAAAR